MDQHEIELIQKYAPTDPELQSLWDDHLLYKRQVDELESKKFLTTSEQQTLKQLKKQKLNGKTKLMQIVDSLKLKEQGKQVD